MSSDWTKKSIVYPKCMKTSSDFLPLSNICLKFPMHKSSVAFIITKEKKTVVSTVSASTDCVRNGTQQTSKISC